jgi:hypothetical protein
MADVRIEDHIAAGIDAVWGKIADFGGIGAWAPGLDKCELEGEGVGSVRRITMGGMEIAERLEKLDEAGRSLTYSIIEGPMPVENYLATITITEAGDERSHILWTCTFDAPNLTDEQARGMAGGMEGAYKGMVEGLKKVLV